MATTFKVTTLAQIRELVQDVPWDVNPSFMVRKSTSLADAHDILGHVSAKGGHGILLNPDLLLHKEEALEFVQRKLTHLRRWKRYMESKLSKVDEKLTVLKSVVEKGGPGVRAVHEPSCFQGDHPCLDTEQDIHADDMATHIAQIRALVLEASPGSPAAEGYRSAKASIAREKAEQLDISRFNVAYLEVKREALALVDARLEQGIKQLEATFVCRPSCLGAESADFGRFEEVVTHAGEVVRAV